MKNTRIVLNGEKGRFSVPNDWLDKKLTEAEWSYNKLAPHEVNYLFYLATQDKVCRKEGHWIVATPEDVLKRWPRLVAHLICESLGYFTPKSAANAILHFKKNEPFFCVWYCHMAQFRNKEGNMYDKESLREVTQDVLKWAIERRHRRKGYMADYKQVRAVITAELKGKGPEFASWF